MLIQLTLQVDEDAFDACNTKEDLMNYIRSENNVNCVSVFPQPVNTRALKQVETLQDVYDILKENKIWIGERKPNSQGYIRTDLSFRCKSGVLYRFYIIHNGTALDFVERFLNVTMDFEEAHYIRDYFRMKEAKGEEFSMHKLMQDAEDIGHTLYNLGLILMQATENIRPKVPVMGVSQKKS